MKVNDKIIEELKALLVSGSGTQDLVNFGHKYNTRIQTIRRWSTKYCPDQYKVYKNNNECNEVLTIKKYKKTYSVERIAKLLGVSPQRIYRLIEKHNINYKKREYYG